MRKTQFIVDGYYHIYNRGVDGQNVFRDIRDYMKFILNLEILNKTNPNRLKTGSQKLIDLVAFCLMPNHYHLLVRQCAERGIVHFMHKMGISYTKYFNTKYDRTGVLFQSRYKAISVDTDEYFIHLSRYIHLNPLDLAVPHSHWERNSVKNIDTAMQFIENYQWSSFADCIGIRNKFSNILNFNLIYQLCGSSEEYKKFVREWAPEKLTMISNLLFD